MYIAPRYKEHRRSKYQRLWFADTAHYSATPFSENSTVQLQRYAVLKTRSFARKLNGCKVENILRVGHGFRSGANLRLALAREWVEGGEDWPSGCKEPARARLNTFFNVWLLQRHVGNFPVADSDNRVYAIAKGINDQWIIYEHQTPDMQCHHVAAKKQFHLGYQRLNHGTRYISSRFDKKKKRRRWKSENE